MNSLVKSETVGISKSMNSEKQLYTNFTLKKRCYY